ncbi:MAG: 16S rRNA (cytidine(1402)-2'-O)-methyltransferase [Crocinitomicaceae bacterium]|jgi:16S rRNA (cytidine1402-2'-O)-methyltransferase
MSKLYIVPTPIGNLEDITLRAIRILQETDLIFAEDTRVTKKLLNYLDISKPAHPFHAHNEHKSLSSVIDKIKANISTVLVSDAGTPGISDPGFLLIRECISKGIEIECLPGPTALIPAIVSSGFPCDRFVFEGFLPHKKGRQTRLLVIAEEKRTSVLYESPHRLVKCLGQIMEFMGEDKKVCVAREITKIYEEYKRGTVKEIKEYYEAHPPKGEIVIVIEGKEGK